MSFDINQLRIGVVGLGYVGLPLAVEFGLGEATRIDELRVRWPCGDERAYTGAEADRFIRIRESVSAVTLE